MIPLQIILAERQGQKYNICKAEVCGQFPDDLVISSGDAAGKTYGPAEWIFIVIRPDGRRCMCLAKSLLNPFSSLLGRMLWMSFRNPHDFHPAPCAHCIFKFSGDLFAGDRSTFISGLISEIIQVDQQCQHVIFCPESVHIVLARLLCGAAPNLSTAPAMTAVP